MYIVPIEQLKSFGIFLIYGAIIGILFDIFRVIRKSFKISDLHTSIEDLIFGIFLGIYLIYILFVINNDNIRLYMIISILLGLILYIKLLSKYFIKINVTILMIIKELLNYIIFKPLIFLLNFIKKILRKPYVLLIININKIKNVISYQKIKKNLHNRKDFTE